MFYVHESQMNPDSEYYPMKLDNLHQAELSYQSGNEISSPLPPKLNFQTNYSCNARCKSCPIERPLHKKMEMDVELFNRIAEETFPTAVLISTTTLGEPTMLPWFRHLCTTAKNYDVLADIVTNGMLLDEDNIGSILSIAADVKISYDSSEEELFNLLRPGCKKSTIDTNLRKLLRQRDISAPQQKPTVTIQSTLMKSNIHQLPEIVSFASDVGADRVKAYYMISYSSDMDCEVLAGEDSLYRHYIEESRELAKETGLVFEASEESAIGTIAGIHGVRCTTAWHQMWIDYDGLVYPCHSHNGYSLGQAACGIADIWNNNRYRALRRTDGREKVLPCYLCGMLFERDGDNPVPYDSENFLSASTANRTGTGVRWSNRSRLFDHTGKED